MPWGGKLYLKGPYLKLLFSSSFFYHMSLSEINAVLSLVFPPNLFELIRYFPNDFEDDLLSQ